MHELDHAVKVVCAWHPNLKLEFPMIRETTIFTEWLDQRYNDCTQAWLELSNR